MKQWIWVVGALLLLLYGYPIIAICLGLCGLVDLGTNLKRFRRGKLHAAAFWDEFFLPAGHFFLLLAIVSMPVMGMLSLPEKIVASILILLLGMAAISFLLAGIIALRKKRG